VPNTSSRSINFGLRLPTAVMQAAMERSQLQKKSVAAVIVATLRAAWGVKDA
jgi:hypothetical protein